MDDVRASRSTITNISDYKGMDFHKPFGLASPPFFTQIPQRIENCIKSHFKKSAKDDKTTNSVLRRENEPLTSSATDLDMQLKAWKENPTWVDETPEVKEVISRRVLVDEGSRQVVDVEQAALWRFLWWSGTIAIHVIVDQNREDHSMKFQQVKTGFMKRFEGSWKVQPLFVDEQICCPVKPKTWSDYNHCTEGKGRVASVVTLTQLIEPALLPPPPISWYLRGITTRTTEMLIQDLLIESARIRGDFGAAGTYQDRNLLQGAHGEDVKDQTDIKESWKLRRRNMRSQSNSRRFQER